MKLSRVLLALLRTEAQALQLGVRVNQEAGSTSTLGNALANAASTGRAVAADMGGLNGKRVWVAWRPLCFSKVDRIWVVAAALG